MTDDTPDKPKRSNGVLWYVGLGLALYAATMLPVVALTEWAVNEGWMSEDIGSAIALVYMPGLIIVVALGLDQAFSVASEALQQMLP